MAYQLSRAFGFVRSDNDKGARFSCPRRFGAGFASRAKLRESALKSRKSFARVNLYVGAPRSSQPLARARRARLLPVEVGRRTQHLLIRRDVFASLVLPDERLGRKLRGHRCRAYAQGLILHQAKAGLSKPSRIRRRRIDSGIAKEPPCLFEGIARRRYPQGAIFEHLVHAHEVVGLVQRVGDDADVEGAEIREQRLAFEVAGEQNVLFNLERSRELPHRFERGAGADDNCAEVAKSAALDEMSDRAHQVIDAVLLIDDPNIAKNELAPSVQPWLRLDAMDAQAIGNPVDDLDLGGRLAAAAYGDVFEGPVGGDDVVGRPVAQPLEHHQRSIENPLLAEFDDEQFWRDVVLIIDEALAHELEWQRRKKDDVRRTARLDDRKASFTVDLEQEPEFVEQRSRIFSEVSKRAPPLSRQGMAVDRNVVDDLERLRKVAVGRTNHRHDPSGAMEGLSLLPNPSIEGDRQGFNDDDAGTGLARGRHGRPSIVRIRGFR